MRIGLQAPVLGALVGSLLAGCGTTTLGTSGGSGGMMGTAPEIQQAETARPEQTGERAVPAQPVRPVPADQSFVSQLAMGNRAEIAAGQVAQGKAISDAVKAFATRMVNDHSQAGQQLMAVAQPRGYSVPDVVDPADAAQMQQMGALSGDAFDSAYMRQQVEAHQKTLALLDQEIASGQDSAIRLAASTLRPTVAQHLQIAQGIVAQMSPRMP